MYKPGDFVRIKIFKPKRLKPNWTYKDGPLLEMNGDADAVRWAGVYTITRVIAGYSGQKKDATDPNSRNTLSLAPTYEIIARWSKESTPRVAGNPGTVPSEVKVLTAAQRDVTVTGIGITRFPAASYPRKFMKDELFRVPHDKQGPIVQGTKDLGPLDTNTEEEEDEPAAAPQPTGKKKAPTPPPNHATTQPDNHARIR